MDKYKIFQILILLPGISGCKTSIISPAIKHKPTMKWTLGKKPKCTPQKTAQPSRVLVNQIHATYKQLADLVATTQKEPLNKNASLYTLEQESKKWGKQLQEAAKWEEMIIKWGKSVSKNDPSFKEIETYLQKTCESTRDLLKTSHAHHNLYLTKLQVAYANKPGGYTIYQNLPSGLAEKPKTIPTNSCATQTSAPSMHNQESQTTSSYKEASCNTDEQSSGGNDTYSANLSAYIFTPIHRSVSTSNMYESRYISSPNSSGYASGTTSPLYLALDEESYNSDSDHQTRFSTPIRKKRATSCQEVQTDIYQKEIYYDYDDPLNQKNLEWDDNWHEDHKTINPNYIWFGRLNQILSMVMQNVPGGNREQQAQEMTDLIKYKGLCKDLAFKQMSNEQYLSVLKDIHSFLHSHNLHQNSTHSSMSIIRAQPQYQEVWKSIYQELTEEIDAFDNLGTCTTYDNQEITRNPQELEQELSDDDEYKPSPNLLKAGKSKPDLLSFTCSVGFESDNNE